jgi:hypothetical protein
MLNSFRHAYTHNSIFFHSSIHPLLNTYTDLVGRLSLELTTSGDMTLVETNSDARLGSSHCI